VFERKSVTFFRQCPKIKAGHEISKKKKLTKGKHVWYRYWSSFYWNASHVAAGYRIFPVTLRARKKKFMAGYDVLKWYPVSALEQLRIHYQGKSYHKIRIIWKDSVAVRSCYRYH
jgi:hypothetical protein